MKHRDQLLVLAVASLAASAALLAPRDGRPWLSALLSLAALSIALVAWARWLFLGGPELRARALVFNGVASLVAGTLWLEFVLAELRGLASPLRWALAIALAWMATPFLALALTRLARRLGR